MLEFLKRALPWTLAALLFIFGWNIGSNSKDAEWKEVVTHEYIKKQEANKATQLEVNKVSTKYQADLEGLEGSTDRIIADLRSDNVRLRLKVKPTTGTPTGDGRCIFDGKAELDEATAKRLIGITQRGDLHIEALQDTIRKLQGGKQ